MRQIKKASVFDALAKIVCLRNESIALVFFCVIVRFYNDNKLTVTVFAQFSWTQCQAATCEFCSSLCKSDNFILGIISFLRFNTKYAVVINAPNNTIATIQPNHIVSESPAARKDSRAIAAIISAVGICAFTYSR